jgi:hypothetical protein
MMPAIALNLATFNRHLLKGLGMTFQTLLVCANAAIMTATCCTLFRHQPAKVAMIVLALPNFLCAAVMDSYPEEGRVHSSRLYFTLSLIGLCLLQIGVTFKLMRGDDFLHEVYNGWGFRTSEMAGNALTSLIVFTVRNLSSSIFRAGTLAVRQSDVVCVKMDEHALRVLLAVHAFLIEEAQGLPGQLAPGLVHAIGVVVAAL